MGRIFFTADLHIGHKSILAMYPDRPFASAGDIALHDEWLTDLWRRTVSRDDTVYVLGDLTFYKSKDASILLSKLPGRKFLISGNHDGSLKSLKNYFVKTSDLLKVRIKADVSDDTRRELNLMLCHYPMIDWDGKHDGTVMLHGHCHGNLDEYNAKSPDLRFDVGIDGELAKECGGFIDVDTLRRAIDEKIRRFNQS